MMTRPANASYGIPSYTTLRAYENQELTHVRLDISARKPFSNGQSSVVR